LSGIISSACLLTVGARPFIFPFPLSPCDALTLPLQHALTLWLTDRIAGLLIAAALGLLRSKNIWQVTNSGYFDSGCDAGAASEERTGQGVTHRAIMLEQLATAIFETGARTGLSQIEMPSGLIPASNLHCRHLPFDSLHGPRTDRNQLRHL
jgi:hypothetical protein